MNTLHSIKPELLPIPVLWQKVIANILADFAYLTGDAIIKFKIEKNKLYIRENNHWREFSDSVSNLDYWANQGSNEFRYDMVEFK